MTDEENNNGVFHNHFPEMNKIKSGKHCSSEERDEHWDGTERSSRLRVDVKK